MSTNQTGVMTSHNLLNYSGMLFSKGNTATPFLTMIGGKSRKAESFEFPTSLSYTNEGGTTQPAISETDSLTAPEPSFTNRKQETNVCQIYQEAISISYGKKSAKGQLSGLNVAGQKATPTSELDFQVARKMTKINNDIDFTFLNGKFQDGKFDDVAYKTRGILEAIKENTLDVSGKPLGYWIVAELMEKISKGEAPTDGLVLFGNSKNIMQINADAATNGLTIYPAARNINGLKIDEILTPFGTVGIAQEPKLPVGTALIANIAICSPVELEVEDKGNFFLEPLSKDGAADKYQIYGQLGLDYGAEWYHGKITGLSTTFTAPEYSKKVYLSGGNITANAGAAMFANSENTETTEEKTVKESTDKAKTK